MNSFILWLLDFVEEAASLLGYRMFCQLFLIWIKKNYFYSTFLGLIPTLFIINSVGSGIENLIDKNINLTFKDIVFDPGIYWPIIIFLFLLFISIIIKGKLFKGENNENKKSWYIFLAYLVFISNNLELWIS